MGTARAAVSGVTLAILVAVCGCSSSSSSDAPKDVQSSSTSPSASTSPLPSAPTYPGLTVTTPAGLSTTQQAILLGYEKFWVALLAASAHPQPINTGVLSTTTGNAQSFFNKYLSGLAGKQQTQSGPVGLHPTITRSTSSLATISDCVDFTKFQIYDKSGKRVDAITTQDQQVTAQLYGGGTTWRVGGYTQGALGCKP